MTSTPPTALATLFDQVQFQNLLCATSTYTAAPFLAELPLKRQCSNMALPLYPTFTAPPSPPVTVFPVKVQCEKRALTASPPSLLMLTAPPLAPARLLRKAHLMNVIVVSTFVLMAIAPPHADPNTRLFSKMTSSKCPLALPSKKIAPSWRSSGPLADKSSISLSTPPLTTRSRIVRSPPSCTCNNRQGPASSPRSRFNSHGALPQAALSPRIVLVDRSSIPLAKLLVVTVMSCARITSRTLSSPTASCKSSKLKTLEVVPCESTLLGPSPSINVRAAIHTQPHPISTTVHLTRVQRAFLINP
mmetsp:Transcript_9942/g.20771  ORF Transcript_9942/g.20771 Transcript_9942/m.20771 type:complete len:303 (-) Transcript_9942:133-1041(-)